MREFLPFSLLLHPNRIPLFSLSHFRRSSFPLASTRISISSSLFYLVLFFTLLIFSLIWSLFSVCLDAPCSSISWKSSVLSTCRSFFATSLLLRNSLYLFSFLFFSLYFFVHMYTRHIYI